MLQDNRAARPPCGGTRPESRRTARARLRARPGIFLSTEWSWTHSMSGQFGACVHCEPAFMVARPQGNAFSILAPTNGETMDVEQRAHRPKGKPDHLCIGHAASQQVDQQCGDQRTVHDQSGVTLDFGHVWTVVVDAMAVER